MLKDLHIYTDGACSQNREGNWHGGYGVYIDWDNSPKKISGGAIDTTNNKMELTAMLEALTFIHKNIDEIKKDFNDVIIYTDSAYIANAFDQNWFIKWKKNGWLTAKKKPVKNKELWQEIYSLFITIQDSIIVNIIKVAAHSNIEGNEIADDLAVKERKSYRKKDNIIQHNGRDNDAYDMLE